jgi:Zn finger protein HypA/HybF involved in hydrogenase expression
VETFEFECSACRKRIKVVAHFVGKEVICPACGNTLVIPISQALVGEQPAIAPPEEGPVTDDLAYLAKAVGQQSSRRGSTAPAEISTLPSSVTPPTGEADLSLARRSTSSGCATPLFVLAFLFVACSISAFSERLWPTGTLLLFFGGAATWLALIILRGSARIEVKRKRLNPEPVQVGVPVAPPRPTVQQGRAREFQRTCRRCGTVWHSRISHERSLGFNRAWGALGLFVQRGNPGMQVFSGITANQAASELQQTRRCPKCNSSAYSEIKIS